jgi:hypothetical protein
MYKLNSEYKSDRDNAHNINQQNTNIQFHSNTDD